jgi:hypothetical protein
MSSPSFKHTFPIERFATLLEDPARLRGELDGWYGLFRPSSPAKCALLEIMVMSLIRGRRASDQLTALVNEQIRMAVFRFDCEQEDKVHDHGRMLATQAEPALVELKRTALGCR